MRAKPILTYGLLAGALALPGLGACARPRQADGAIRRSASRLSAQIELTSGAKEELDSLAAHDRRSVALSRRTICTYQGVLVARARHARARRRTATPYLRVTSPAPVNEPYLDLLVEVNWASGRVVRDYTFLLDPPGMPADVAPVEPVTPPRAGSAAPRAPAAAAAQPRRPPAAAPAAPRGRRATRYTVKRGDTLSKIAKEYKPETVTLDQMLVALFKQQRRARSTATT